MKLTSFTEQQLRQQQLLQLQQQQAAAAAAAGKIHFYTHSKPVFRGGEARA